MPKLKQTPAKTTAESVESVAESTATNNSGETESVAVIHADLIAHMQSSGLVAISPQFHTDSDKANVKLAVSGHRDNSTGRTLQPRSTNLYLAARAVYGNKHFRARGLDNSVCAMLIANGYFRLIPNTGESYTDPKLSGVKRLRDAPDSPVMLQALSRKA